MARACQPDRFLVVLTCLVFLSTPVSSAEVAFEGILVCAGALGLQDVETGQKVLQVAPDSEVGAPRIFLVEDNETVAMHDTVCEAPKYVEVTGNTDVRSGATWLLPSRLELVDTE